MLQNLYKPHKTTNVFGAIVPFLLKVANTPEEVREQAEKYVVNYIESTLIFLVDDAIAMAIQNALQHTTNAETLALARDRIAVPQHRDDVLRFNIAFRYEVQQAAPALVESVVNDYVYHQTRRVYLPREQPQFYVDVRHWVARANKIVELMTDYVPIVGKSFIQVSEWMRNAAMIDLGEKVGVRLTTTGNGIEFEMSRISTGDSTVKQYEPLLPNQSVLIEDFSGVRFQTPKQNNTDTFKITAKNGANFVKVKTSATEWGAETLLAKDAERTLTATEMQFGVGSRPLQPPTATRTLPDIRMQRIERRSVSLAGVFTGERRTMTLESSNTDIVNPEYNSESDDLILTTSNRTGTVTIILRVTNESGRASLSFEARVP